MSKTIAIDIAEKEEWDAVLSLTKAAYSEYAAESDKEFWSGYQQSIAETLLTDDSVMRIVAKAGTMLMGAVLYCPPYEKQMGNAFVKNPFPEMRLLAIPPEFRNRGVAGRLIAFCEEKARLSGSQTMTLHTTALMQTAKQMYEKRGYLRYPEIDFEPVPGFIVWGYRKDFEMM